MCIYKTKTFKLEIWHPPFLCLWIYLSAFRIYVKYIFSTQSVGKSQLSILLLAKPALFRKIMTENVGRKHQSVGCVTIIESIFSKSYLHYPNYEDTWLVKYSLLNHCKHNHKAILKSFWVLHLKIMGKYEKTKNSTIITKPKQSNI